VADSKNSLLKKGTGTSRSRENIGNNPSSLGASPLFQQPTNSKVPQMLQRTSWALGIALLIGSPAGAQEWTRFRGPNGSGATEATTVPAAWTDRDYNWKVKLPGEGHSAPVLWGERLFITSAESKDATQHVLCINRMDGKILWQKSYSSLSHDKHRLNTFASSTPCVDDERLYLTWAVPEAITLLVLTHDGEEVWRKDLGPFINQHGWGTSPIVYKELVVVSNDQGDPQGQKGKGASFLAAFDRKTGQERWRIPRKTREVAYSTPCVYRGAGGKDELIFNCGIHGITGVDPATGKVNWEIDVFDQRSCSSPIIVGDLVFGSCGQGKGNTNYVVAVRPPDGENRTAPEIAYRMTRASQAPYVPGFVAKGDRVFLWSDGGYVTCIEAATGRQIWHTAKLGREFYGSPIRVADKIYCMETNGELVVVAAADKFQLLARNKLGEHSNSTPAVADGVMYLRTLTQLMSVGGSKANSR
jgi:outer membrane protein assembly factor BamB